LSIDWLFWSATLFLFIFEWGVSHAYSDSPFFPKKGLITDIAAAATMWALSFFVYITANAISINCKSAGQLTDFDKLGCVKYSADVSTIGDVLNTTFGLNPILAATVSFIGLGICIKIYNWSRLQR
jgi:hypothetical protein